MGLARCGRTGLRHRPFDPVILWKRGHLQREMSTQGLGFGTFLFRHSDVGADLKAADFDGVRHGAFES